jgi:hypothetical protein
MACIEEAEEGWEYIRSTVNRGRTDSGGVRGCYNDGYGDCLEQSYQILASLPPAVCQTLALNLDGQCESANLVLKEEASGGTIGSWFTFAIYGLFTLADGNRAIVPLVNFDATYGYSDHPDSRRGLHSYSFIENEARSFVYRYVYDQGVPQYDAEAVRWYRQYADEGDVNAQFLVGTMYADGRGVPQDYIQAHMWWSLAAAEGDEDAVTNRDTVAAQMTPAQIAEAQRLATAWRPQ